MQSSTRTQLINVNSVSIKSRQIKRFLKTDRYKHFNAKILNVTIYHYKSNKMYPVNDALFGHGTRTTSETIVLHFKLFRFVE